MPVAAEDAIALTLSEGRWRSPIARIPDRPTRLRVFARDRSGTKRRTRRTVLLPPTSTPPSPASTPKESA